MIKVLIVDDSASTRMFLQQMFSADPELVVVGTANNGIEAIAEAERLAPDVITMDIDMPQMNGLDATRRIMETRPTPIIILSGVLDTAEVVSSFRALEAGAVAALLKPRGAGHPDHEREVGALIQTIKLMSEIKLVRRWPLLKKGEPAFPATETVQIKTPTPPRVVAVGASTGGPVVIRDILAGLGKEFTLPVLIVQHMAAGFIRGFAEWLTLSSGTPVHIASQSERLIPGHAYMAPDGYHLLADTGERIKLSDSAPENGLRPAVSALFRSVANVYGNSAIGVLLTGMGRDGVDELLLMKEKGAVTIVQDQASSVIYGMPAEAVKLGAALYTLPPGKIAAMLVAAGRQPAGV
ncbi:MAG TPA: chemotaxis-specific protein-glutamate methyltransferase CheB [Geobacteraceae bacterium]|nr:chemotaxis-specific protein-glutamate methyltransferase CheB [Geobacteraceae bacterium]